MFDAGLLSLNVWLILLLLRSGANSGCHQEHRNGKNGIRDWHTLEDKYFIQACEQKKTCTNHQQLPLHPWLQRSR